MSLTSHKGQIPSELLSFHIQYLCTKHDPQTIVVTVVAQEWVYRRCAKVVVLGTFDLDLETPEKMSPGHMVGSHGQLGLGGRLGPPHRQLVISAK